MTKLKIINTKLICIGLILFILGLFINQEVQPYITSYFEYKHSNQTPYIQVSLPEPELTEIPNTLTDISDISFVQLKNFDKNDSQNPVFIQDGEKYEIVYNGNKISFIQLSPDQQKIGFYKFSPDKTGYDRVSFVIMDLNTRKFKEIKDKYDNFSNWEWRDNDTVDIGINCGSSCHYTQVTSIENGQIIAQYFKGQKFHF